MTHTHIKRAARVKCHNSSVSLHFKSKNIKWRPCRKKPQRTVQTEAKRVMICKKWLRLPNNYFFKTVDMIIDCKKFDVPTSAAGRTHLRKLKVRGTHRLPSEGLNKGHTKPDTKRNRHNTGSSVHIAAGVMGDKIVLWEEIPGKKWNAQVAKELYEGPIHATLQAFHPKKKKFLIYEDNDPTGFKSAAAKAAKRKLGIKTMTTPTYSPDLNPLDFTLWKSVERRTLAKRIKGKETRQSYCRRLRLTALRTHKKTVKKSVMGIKARAKQVIEKKGAAIPMD